MGRTRLTLHEELCTVLESRNCYFDPPSILEYPCIIYQRNTPWIDYADNIKYHRRDSWIITIVDTDPDSEIRNRLEEHFKNYCSWDREYPGSDGLYHFVYTLYY